jgi:hypothetical protein
MMKILWMKLFIWTDIYDESGFIICSMGKPKKGFKWIIDILNTLKLM